MLKLAEYWETSLTQCFLHLLGTRLYFSQSGSNHYKLDTWNLELLKILYFCQLSLLSGLGWLTGDVTKAWLTVCAAADKGVRCTGVLRWLRLSHRTIWPEYVPPTTKLGWNRAKQTDITEDCEGKGREEHRERLGESLFLPEEKAVHYINPTHSGKHKAMTKCRVSRTFCTQTFPWEGGQWLPLETWNPKSWPGHQIGIKPIWCTSLLCGLESLLYGHFPLTNKTVSELILILHFTKPSSALRSWPHQVILWTRLARLWRLSRWGAFSVFGFV